MSIVGPFLLDDQGSDAPGRHHLRNSVDAVIRYHAETKHHVQVSRYRGRREFIGGG